MSQKIIGSGMYVPGDPISNQDLIERWGYDLTPEKITRLTGIEHRYIAEDGEGLVDLCANAARIAIENSGLENPEEDIEQVLVAISTADDVFPNTASAVAGRLGLKTEISCQDSNMACAGFVKILQQAADSTNPSRYRNTLIIGGDVLSRITDYSDYRTGTLFGDGAGAMVVSYEQNGSSGLVASSSLTLPNRDILYCPNYQDALIHPDRYIAMNGREVYRKVRELVSGQVRDVFGKAELSLQDKVWCLFHQANANMLYQTADDLGIPRENVPIQGLKTTGNTSAATIPIAYDIDVRARNIKDGDRLLLSGFGSGFVSESVIWKQ